MGSTKCGTRRRLAEERRLAVAVNSAYAVSGLTKTQVNTAKTAVEKTSRADIKTAITTAIAADTSLSGINVTGVKKLSVTVTDTNNVSVAAAVGFLSMVILAGVSHVF